MRVRLGAEDSHGTADSANPFPPAYRLAYDNLLARLDSLDWAEQKSTGNSVRSYKRGQHAARMTTRWGTITKSVEHSTLDTGLNEQGMHVLGYADDFFIISRYA
ncbi:hypothetical protein J6590_072052 [Homalodisca vitripennis]|nr:hypothetical protein J6590_072052 [Homalodisca vitripennis]